MSNGNRCKHSFFIFAFFFLAASLAGYAAEQSGTVRSGMVPLRYSIVMLYAAGRSTNTAAVNLGSAQTDAKGAFTIAFTAPTDPGTILYILADGGIPRDGRKNHPQSSAIRLAAVLGPGAISSGVVINERTTVATAYALAQFLSGNQIAGKSPGLQNAAATNVNLVDPRIGEWERCCGVLPTA
jgi:hypothetical protein